MTEEEERAKKKLRREYQLLPLLWQVLPKDIINHLFRNYLHQKDIDLILAANGSKCILNNNKFLAYCIKKGYYNLLVYVCEKSQKIKLWRILQLIAVNYNKLDCLKYLYEYFQEWETRTLYCIMHFNRDIEFLSYIYDNGVNFSNCHLIFSISRDNADALKYLEARFGTDDVDLLIHIYQKNATKCLKYLCESRPIDWEQFTCTDMQDDARSTDFIECARYYGCPQ